MMIEAYKGSEPYLFVSYAHVDSEAVMKILHWLNNAGYRVWYDEGIEFGADFPDEIATALKNCAQYIVFLSRNSIARPYVKREINYAINLDKKIIPIYLEEVDMPDGMALTIGTIQGILKYKLSEDDFHRYLNKGILSQCKGDESPVKTVSLATDDYILFGHYQGEPILWQCICQHDSPPRLVSEYILCLKAFDAAESGIQREGQDEIEMYGDNHWEHSNIREWLNSSETKVTYSTQPPTESAVCNHYNPYADEPGFLNSFTETELELIGTEKNSSWGDRIFLLDEGLLPLLHDHLGASYEKLLTDKAVESSNHQVYGPEYTWWLRTPVSFIPSRCRIINFDGTVYASPVYCDNGIVPALELKSNFLPVKGGSGKKRDPYYL